MTILIRLVVPLVPQRPVLCGSGRSCGLGRRMRSVRSFNETHELEVYRNHFFLLKLIKTHNLLMFTYNDHSILKRTYVMQRHTHIQLLNKRWRVDRRKTLSSMPLTSTPEPVLILDIAFEASVGMNCVLSLHKNVVRHVH